MGIRGSIPPISSWAVQRKRRGIGFLSSSAEEHLGDCSVALVAPLVSPEDGYATTPSSPSGAPRAKVRSNAPTKRRDTQIPNASTQTLSCCAFRAVSVAAEAKPVTDCQSESSRAAEMIRETRVHVQGPALPIPAQHAGSSESLEHGWPDGLSDLSRAQDDTHTHIIWTWSQRRPQNLSKICPE